MEGDVEGDGDRGIVGADNSAAEGDGDRGRYSCSLLVRCGSQSSLDESSRGAGGDAEGACAGGAGGEHASALLDALALLRRDAVLCDVELRADDGSPPVPAHRAVLAASSPYFRAMFTQFDERTMHSITIQKVEGTALEAVVEYVYAPQSLVLSARNVQGVLACASLLQVWGARAACAGYLATALAPDNALGIRAFADLHACALLAQRATDFVHRHFVDVLRHDEFLALDAPQLAELLRSDRVHVPNEEVVLDAVLAWMQHEPEERRAQLAVLLEHVRLPLLARDSLVQRAAAEPLLSADLRVKDLVIEALSFHLMRPERRLAAASSCARARPRRPPRAPQLLLVVGGQAPKAIRDVEAYHMESGRWSGAASLPSRRCRAGLAAVGGRVFAVGGFNGTLRVRTVDVYDAARDAWSAASPLAARRSTLGVAVIDHVIYAVGGFDGATGLSSAEALDTRVACGVWRPIASMSTRRSSVGVAALAGQVYAVGGYDGSSRQCLHTCERYSPADDAWQRVADMSARRSGAAVAVVEGALYAVGGHDGPAVRRSVERFTGSSWVPAASMAHARRNAGVAVHAARMYVVGGDDGAANLTSVEMYDPTTDAWTVLATSMSVGRSYAGVCVVDAPHPPHSPHEPPSTPPP